MMKVVNAQGQPLLSRVTWCATFGSKLRGLMFRRSIAADEGLILAETRSSIAAIWLDEDWRVVHKVCAKAWRPYYAAPRPAKFVLEGPPALLDRITLGETLRLEE